MKLLYYVPIKSREWGVLIIIRKLKSTQEGVYTEARKERTEDKPLEVATPPERAIFPMTMHIGKPATPLVKVGDKVKIGTMIAKRDGPISANIHSSISGEVVDIGEYPAANRPATAIVVKNDYKDEEERPLFKEGEELDRGGIIDVIEQAGVVGMGGAMFPTNIKLSPPEVEKIDTLIINGAECEPYATSDRLLMIEHAQEIVDGVQVLLKLFPAKKVYIGIEDYDQDSIAAIKKVVDKIEPVDFVELDTIYPQGSEKSLIRTITGREVPAGKLPADVGIIVINTATTFAIHEAVNLGKPSTKRVTTVTGSPLKNPRNLWVRIGTPIESLIQDVGGFEKDPAKIIHGGPMMGQAITSGRVPVMKGTTHITFLEKSEIEVEERSPCIRCSECLYVCPVNLQPIMISNAYEEGDLDRAEKLGALDCIDCGACSFICPSKIPILENIKKAKSEITEQRESA